VSQYFYGAARKAAPLPRLAGARPLEPRGAHASGRIVRLLVGQGQGFIRLRDGREVFFHRSDVAEGTSFNDFVVGDTVTFELLEDAVSGARALRVSPRQR